MEFRELERSDVARLGEIDRTERIEVLYDKHGIRLTARRGEWTVPPWDRDGRGEHSVEARVRDIERLLGTGGVGAEVRGSGTEPCSRPYTSTTIPV